MEDVRSALLELQALDEEIASAVARIGEFGPQLEALEQPLRVLEQDLETTRTRLAELRQTARKLEHGAEQKRERLKSYEVRLERARRVEAGEVRSAMDLIRKAADTDETEALEMMEQVTRTDLKVDDLQRQLDKLRAEVLPRKEELLAARISAEEALAVLQDRRRNQTIRLDAGSLRLYERVRSGRSRTVLAPMTAEGACGNCFNVLPIQQQSEVRHNGPLVRCEACGVILYPPQGA
jgi:predicted  nucleic acid-binding Zn-ribbon protein